MPRSKVQTSVKVQAITRLLQDGEDVSSICADLKISPVELERWRSEVIGGLGGFFDGSLRRQERAKDRRICALEQEVARKQEVIGELMEAYTLSKKRMGRSDRRVDRPRTP